MTIFGHPLGPTMDFFLSPSLPLIKRWISVSWMYDNSKKNLFFLKKWLMYGFAQYVIAASAQDGYNAL